MKPWDLKRTQRDFYLKRSLEVGGGRKGDEAEDMLLRKKGEGLLSAHGVPHHLYNLRHFDKGIFKFIFHPSIIYPFDESKDK